MVAKKTIKKVKEKSTGKDDQDCTSRSSCAMAGDDGSGCAGCASKQGVDPFAEQNKSIATTFANIKQVLFVMSGKGGVGKSSVSVNLAVALAELGLKVGILDVDLHGPSVINLLGLGSGLDIDEKTGQLIPDIYGKNIKVLSIDSLLRDRNTAIMWRGPKKTTAIRQFCSEVAWGELDYLIIDSPPGTGDEHLTILNILPQSLAVMVTTPQELSLADVRKAMNFLQHTRANLLGIVENMSGLTCPNCGTEIPLFNKGGGKTLAAQYNVPFLGELPLDPATVVAADKGVPVVLLEGDHAIKKGFFALARTIHQSCINKEIVQMMPPKTNETTP